MQSARPVVYGIITARGGSKSVPKKNIKELLGKPLIAWTIEAAKKAPSLDRIICSTDSEEIAEIAKHFGAEVPFFRPPEYAEDNTPDFPVFEHALSWFEEHEQKIPDAVVHVRPTCPLKTPEDIEAAIALLLAHPEADSVRCVAEVPHHPLKMYRFNRGFLEPFVPEHVYGIREPHGQPRQALPKAYASFAYLSAVWSRTIREQQSLSGKKMLGLVVSEENVFDINTALDFEIATVLLRARLAKRAIR